MVDLAPLEKTLCEALCAQVKLVPRPNGLVAVSSPLTFPDGDSLPIFIRRLQSGGLEFTDLGNSLMRLSYEIEPDAIREGMRGRILNRVVAEYGLEDRGGEFVLKTAGTSIGTAVFQFSQALSRIHDITFLNRDNVETTFYEDLKRELESIAGTEHVHANYVVPDIERGSDYPVDFYVDGGKNPLYVFGVPNRDKARLATIVLQHLLRNGRVFDSAIVFRDADMVPKTDFKRLAHVANDIVMSVDAREDLARKVRHRIAA